MHLTMPKTFIRYVGNSLHKTDYSRIDAWVDRMKYWLDNGIQQINFFMHMHDEATSPELTVYFVNRINKVCGLNLIPPKFLGDNLELFQKTLKLSFDLHLSELKMSQVLLTGNTIVYNQNQNHEKSTLHSYLCQCRNLYIMYQQKEINGGTGQVRQAEYFLYAGAG